MDRTFMFMEKNVLRGCLPLPRGYIHVYDHNIRLETAWPVKAKLCGASLGKGNESQYKWFRSRDQDGAMAINSKNLYKSYCSEPEDLFETLPEASLNGALQSLYKS